MLTLLGRKKLVSVLKTRELSPAVKYEVKHLIRKYNLSRKDIIDAAYQAIEFLDEMREYELSNKVEKYFLTHVEQVDSEELNEEDDLSHEPVVIEAGKIKPHELDFNQGEFDDNDEEFFFDDDIVYRGFFWKRKMKAVKDRLVLGEDDYDTKRNRYLFKVCFMIALLISAAFFYGATLFLKYLNIQFNYLWLTPAVAVVALGISIFMYNGLVTRDLTWPYDRVMMWSYSLSILYFCIIVIGFVIGNYSIKLEPPVDKEQLFYFKIDPFKDYVTKNPEDPEGRMKLAYAYMCNDDHLKSLEEVNKALHMAPDLVEANDLQKSIVETYLIDKEAVIHFSNGMLYWFIKQDKSALSEFKEAVKLYPKFGAAHYYIACIYYTQREYEKAWNHASEAQKFQYGRVKTLLLELQKYFELPPI